MTQKKTIYYKALNPDGSTPQGYGHYDTSNHDWQPAIVGKLEACENGYHLLRIEDVLEWNCPELWEVEVKGRAVKSDSKVVARSFRFVRKLDTWNERTQRLFACDCAERALALLDKDKIDPRSIEAVRIARLFAIGEATNEARAAAWDAAWAAAWDAARDAEIKWQIERLHAYFDGSLS